MSGLWQVIIVILVPLVLTELVELAPWLANRLAKMSARLLKAEAQRKRYQEEWLADLAYCPGKLTKLLVAIGFLVASLKIRHATKALALSQDSREEEPHTRFVAPLVVFALFLSVWELSSSVLPVDRRYLLPPPHAVVQVAFLDAQNRTDILTALWLSTWIAALGLAIAIVLGVASAIAMSQARWIERSFYPYAVILGSAPTLAMVPVIGFWFDFGLLSRLIITVMTALFPIINSTLFGMQSAGRVQHELFTLHRAGRLTRLWRLQLPAAAPAILTGFQIAATLAAAGAVVGDFFFKQGDAGIGVLIDLYRFRLQSEQLFGAALAAALLGVFAFWLFGLLNRVITGSWYDRSLNGSRGSSGSP